jgi:hypothetical protein
MGQAWKCGPGCFCACYISQTQVPCHPYPLEAGKLAWLCPPEETDEWTTGHILVTEPKVTGQRLRRWGPAFTELRVAAQR